MKVRVNTVGEERNPVVVIDDLVPQAAELITAACRRPFEPVTGNSYPGLRYLITAHSQPEWSYIRQVMQRVSPVLHEVFGLKQVKISHASFSLMTRRPAEAHPMTRLPHYDEIQKTQFALLHFLTPRPQGGTAFYRHRRTGFERITPERKAAFHSGIREDLAEFGEPPVAYMQASNEVYEQIAYYEGRFNRLLIYSGALLHSAQVPDAFGYSSDPAKGRLTTNLFLVVPEA